MTVKFRATAVALCGAALTTLGYAGVACTWLGALSAGTPLSTTFAVIAGAGSNVLLAGMVMLGAKTPFKGRLH